MAARVRTHLLFDMERNSINNECSVMSSRRSAPLNSSALSHNTSFNMCGLNIRGGYENNRPRAQHRHGSGGASERSGGGGGNRITGGFESSDYASNTSSHVVRGRRYMSSTGLRSDSDRSDEVHLMSYDPTTRGQGVNLWDDHSVAKSPVTSDDGEKTTNMPTDKSTTIRGRMYSRKRHDENPRPAFSSPEFNGGSRKLGAVPKRRGNGSTSTTSNRSSLTSSTSSDFFVIPKHLSERFIPIGNVSMFFMFIFQNHLDQPKTFLSAMACQK